MHRTPPGHKLQYSIADGSAPVFGHAPSAGYIATCECGWRAEGVRTGKECVARFGDHIAALTAFNCRLCGAIVSMATRRKKSRWLCASCGAVKDREERQSYKHRNPQQHRAIHLKTKYGLTTSDLDLMLSFQNGGCAICNRPLVVGRKTGLHVDHCHRTGSIRGLLCSRCNHALGLMDANPLALIKAADYVLRRPNGRKVRTIPMHDRLSKPGAAKAPPPDLRAIQWQVGSLRPLIETLLEQPLGDPDAKQEAA